MGATRGKEKGLFTSVGFYAGQCCEFVDLVLNFCGPKEHEGRCD